MTEKENALRMILKTGDPEWVPCSHRCFSRLIPTEVIRERPPKREGSGYDWFGCYWFFDEETNGFFQDLSEPVVPDIRKWRDYVRFPDLDAIEWEKSVPPTTEGIDRENKLLQFSWESGPFERLHSLVGFEQALMSIYTEQEAFKEMLEAITDFRCAAVERVAEYYKPDIIINMDDLGAQKAPLMSGETFRRFLKPCEKRIGDAIKRRGIIYQHHSCGSMDVFAGDLIDCGAAMIHGLLAPYNDLASVQRSFSGKVTVEGGVNRQLIDGAETTEEELREEVRRCISAYGPYKNYVYLSNSMFPERIAIMVDEAVEFGGRFYSR
ncbi:MAG: hypothetical protein FWG32_04775 [Oscillospiraceae bacterium]|nr:hypothetical protein [Oscillospiraceae bacterium]